MKSSNSPYLATVLILGGGQLAWMLVLQGHKMGLRMAVLSESENDPAASIASLHYMGNYKDAETIRKVIRKCSPDAVTIESEFIPAEVLDEVFRSSQTVLYPHPATIGMLQDRLTQKEALAKYGLKTLRFVAVGNMTELEAACQTFDYSFVLKKRMGGFDGRGTIIIRNQGEYEEVCKTIKFSEPDNHLGYIAEEYISEVEDIEYAIQGARNPAGDIVFLPLVKTTQKNAQLSHLVGPIWSIDTHPMDVKIRGFLKEIDYVGTFAFEFFLINRDLIVNETAPRVHNSGHHSLNTCNVDQFTLHLCAILGLPLTGPRIFTQFAMMNLIGTGVEGVEPPTTSSNFLWWYAKASKEMRKLGHITAMGSEMDECLWTLLRERQSMRM